MKLLAQHQANGLFQYGNNFFITGKAVSLLSQDGSAKKIAAVETWAAVLFSDYLVFQNKNGETIHYVNLKTLEHTETAFTGFLTTARVDRDYLYLQQTTGKIHRIDKSFHSTILNIEGRLPVKIHKGVFYNFLSGIFSAKSATGDLLWSTSLFDATGAENLHLYGNIFTHHNKLIFFLSDGNKNIFTIIINAEKGEIIKILENFGGYFFQNDCNLYTFNWYERGVLNLDTLEVQKISLEKILSSETVGMVSNILHTDGITLYFSNLFRAGLGKIDLINNTLVWYNDIPVMDQRSEKINKIYVRGETVFILTTGDQLLIYETP